MRYSVKLTIGIALLSNSANAELLELKPSNTTYNLSSPSGLPISGVFNEPVGSNGQAPTHEEYGDPTKNQFTGYYSSAAVVSPAIERANSLNPGSTLAENAENLDLPRSSDGEYKLTFAASGKAIMSAQPSILFGGIIPPPDSKFENGADILINNPMSFWDEKPYKQKIGINELSSSVVGKVIVKTTVEHMLKADDLINIRNTQKWSGEYIVERIIDEKTFQYDLLLTESEAERDNTSRIGTIGPKKINLDGSEFLQELHSSDGYHFSESARSVFAVKSGPVNVTWKERAGSTVQPQGDEYINWIKLKKKYYKLYNEKYIISGSSVKPTKSYYWNYGAYNGPKIMLPANVSKLDIIYTSTFPKKTKKFSKTDNGQNIPIDLGDDAAYKTLWYNDAQGINARTLYSLNSTGRIFVEILGPQENGVSKHLGFEIVDVYSDPKPIKKIINLGDQIEPIDNNTYDKAKYSILFIGEGRVSDETHDLIYNHVDGNITDYYAKKESYIDDDFSRIPVLAYWKEEGIAAIKWPQFYYAYELVWPEELSEYSQYFRPLAGKADSKLTAVELPNNTTPQIDHQDVDSTGRIRAEIDRENQKFYSWMMQDDEIMKTHRSLIRYVSNAGKIKYERVLSWLDESLNYKLNDDFDLDKYSINTKQIRNLNLWPKVTINGNLTSQVLVFDQLNGVYTGKNNSLRQQIFNGLQQEIYGIGAIEASDTYKNYPRSPVERKFIEKAELVSSVSGDKGVVMEGYFSPALTGNYSFKILFNGSSRLNFSRSESPIDLIPGTGIAKSGDGYDVKDSESAFINFEKDKFYYFKALARIDSNQTFKIHFKEKNSSSYADMTGYIHTGLRVNPIEQNIFKGDIIYFDDNMSYQISNDSNIGDTVLFGELTTKSTQGIPYIISNITGSAFRKGLVRDFNDRIAQDAPRYLELDAYVGQRLNVPDNEFQSGEGEYFPGYIDVREGELLPYHKSAYKNPMKYGLVNSANSRIIPVNANPNNNVLNVLWYRKTVLDADPRNGFGPVYWPAVKVKYTIKYPSDSREIVIASNDGSGPLSSLEAKGSIYVQNDDSKEGFNPNEEHALMLGGQAYALRDDLNVYLNPKFNGELRSDINSDINNYTSTPFVLLEYIDTDGITSITTFKVLKEKGEEGKVFDYLSKAGQLLQSPMPLPLLPKPVQTNGQNFEYEVQTGVYNTPTAWELLKDVSYFANGSTYEVIDGDIPSDALPPISPTPSEPDKHFEHYNKFTYTDRKGSVWTYRGLHKPGVGNSVFNAGNYNKDSKTYENINPVEAVTGESFNLVVHANVVSSAIQMSSANLPNWLSLDGLEIKGIPSADDENIVSSGKINESDKSLVVLDKENDKYSKGQHVLVSDDNNNYYISEILASFIDSDSSQKLRLSTEANSSINTAKIYQVTKIDLNLIESRKSLSKALSVYIRVSPDINGKNTNIFSDQIAYSSGYTKTEGSNVVSILPADRPPHLTEAPTGKNSFSMRYYYFSMPGFYDPALKDNDNIGEYPLNTVLPYQVGPGVTSLRSVVNNVETPSQPADIVYRPIWPTTVPVLNRGDTLAMPKFGLPAMRGQSSAEVLYQQSIANAQQSSLDDMKIVVDSISDSANQYYLQAINPEGSKYESGEYKAINIKINHSAGYKVGDYRVSGVNVFPISKQIAVGKVFHFGNGITFKSSKTSQVNSQIIYGFVEGGDLTNNSVGASGGLHVVTDPRFKYKSYGTIEVGSYQGFRSNYKYGTQKNSGTGGDTGFYNNIFQSVPLSSGLDKELRKGMWINFPNNIKMEILRNVETGSKILKGYETRDGYYYTADFSMHYPADNGGLIKENVGTIYDQSTSSENVVNWRNKTIRFPNGAIFKITEDPVRGDVSLTGTLSGEIPNGLTNYRTQTITLKAGSSSGAYPAGTVFYFNNGQKFIVDADKAANATTVSGKLIGDLNQNDVGYNPTKLITENESVRLIDPTREKVSFYDKEAGEVFPPASILSSYYQGKIYFPNLEPHLSKRIFFDPNRGSNGALVFIGEYLDEPVGEKYFHLNVLSKTDFLSLINLCNASDPEFAKWKAVCSGLKTELEHMVEKTDANDAPIKGVYVKNADKSYVKNVSEVAEILSGNIPVDSYALSAVGPGSGYVSIIVGNSVNQNIQPIGEPVTIHIIRISDELHSGSLKVVQSENPLDEKLTFYHTPDLAGKVDDYDYQWRKAYPVDGTYPDFTAEPRIDEDTSNGVKPINTPGDQWLVIDPETDQPGSNKYVLGKKPGIDILMDTYITVRYKPKNSENNEDWSEWSSPQLAESWVKRVLAGINPFNQRTRDLFNNEVDLNHSILTSAGKRWEGDIALSLASINDFGLIEIYETVLNKAKNLTIDAGINHNGANNTLLLAAGYINDLYMMLGNEAYADAYNPTIGFSTSDGGEIGDFATALFAFKGQLPTLLEEELALLRGRDDFMAPGVEANPVYNRLFWNYTRGIDSGEVIYALNYNIKERGGDDLDGAIDAADAAEMYPQGHGDAFGHYLTALKGYYKLLADEDFTWVPQSESVLVLGQEVAVDYMDERKFAAAAAAYGRSGSQIVDLTWRKDYIPGTNNGWTHLSKTRENERRNYKPAGVVLDSDGNAIDKVNTVRSWGVDHWATRVGQGNYINWLVGNAILPSIDEDPTHEGIQKVDRTTVPELLELPYIGTQLQLSLDNAAAGLNPLGLPENSMPFDIDPAKQSEGETHFDQIYGRAVTALDNAVAAFDQSKDITGIMRGEENSSVIFQREVEEQELAYEHQLIEIYGTPYPGDIGPGKLYKQGYEGPDLLNFSYVDYPTLSRSAAHDAETVNFPRKYKIFIEKLFDVSYSDEELADGIISSEIDNVIGVNTFSNSSGFDKVKKLRAQNPGYTYNFNLIKKAGDDGLEKGVHFIEYELDDHGFPIKPSRYQGKRKSPGSLQTAVHTVLDAHWNIRNSIRQMQALKRKFDLQVKVLDSMITSKGIIRELESDTNERTAVALRARYAADVIGGTLEPLIEATSSFEDTLPEGMPDQFIAGFSVGGNFLAPIKTAISGIMVGVATTLRYTKLVPEIVAGAVELDKGLQEMENNVAIAGYEDSLEVMASISELEDSLNEMRNHFDAIDTTISQYDDAIRNYRSILASGDRILREREIYRLRTASIVQGYRVNDAALRIFRNEKLERFKSMFDLASRYTFLAAKTYDYETGLLDTSKGKRFVSRIVASRALGVVDDGQPQFAGSNTGDPGLSSVLAEMSADWEVLRGRLGFNNPDMYGTTFSLRTEKYRILPNTDDVIWKQVLEESRMDDLLADEDVRQLCMQLQNDDGLPVPGILIEFSTTVQDGLNFFGKKLARGDHTFSPTSFATKILGVGVALDGYEGIDHYSEDSPAPSLNPNGLSSTPYIYLLPVGLDAMRSPPLGDQSGIRVWKVEDATIPTPFNIGGSDHDSKKLYQTSFSLTDRLFNVRKHQAFRPVSDPSLFSGDGRDFPGNIMTHQNSLLNHRLVGRSVWNSRWKLVIPGKSLLYDPNEGLDILIRTLKDIKIHFETYSYSGN